MLKPTLAEARLELSGRLDAAGLARLRDTLIGLLEADIALLDVDLSKVDELDPSWTSVVRRADRRARSKGGHLKLAPHSLAVTVGVTASE